MSVGDVIRYRSPRAREETTGFIGMVVFLGSWAMLFAALFFAYGMVRIRAVAWPPLDQPALPKALPTLATLLLLLSSVALQLGLYGVRRGNPAALRAALPFGLLLGTTFLVLQAVVWTSVFASGVKPNSGPYASVFYALTGFHGLHVVVGLLALAVLSLRARRGVYTAPRHQPVRLWTLYWHFVGVVWLVMFITVYLI